MASFSGIPSDLPKFGSQPTDDFDLFVKKFTRICKGYGLNAERIAALIPLHLTDKAIADYDDMEAEGLLNDLPLAELITRLKERWNRANRPTLGSDWGCSTEFTTYKMKPGETVASYYGHIRERAENAGLFTKEGDRMRGKDLVRMKFIEGLTSRSLKKHL